jgi:hypothetical protein
MRLNFSTILKAVRFVVFIGASAALVSCADNQSYAPVVPVAPGTVQPSGSSTSATGSFQGAILDGNGVAQAILTMDVWEKDGQTNAQLTVSPNGAKTLISLNAGNRSFSVILPANDSGSDTTVAVSGEWTGSAWAGRLLLPGDTTTQAPTKTNTFSLSRGAYTNAAVAIGVPSGTFEGVLKFKTSGELRSASLTIQPTTDIGSALASTLVSRVNLSGVLKYDKTPEETLAKLVWNRETSTLAAVGSLQTSLGIASLNCRLSELNSGARDVLRCVLATSKSEMPLATGQLSQKHVVVAPPFQGPTVQPNPVPQPAPTRAPSMVIKNAKDFIGSAIFTSEQGQKQSRTLTLSVALSSDVTGQTQSAKVKFIIDGSRVGANFNDGTYNGSNGELHAKQLLSLGALPGLLELSCSDVKFENPQYDFVCHYESSVTNVTGEFHLKSAHP